MIDQADARGAIGFVALWNKTDAEYRASERDEWATTQRVQEAFRMSSERGNVSSGLFACRWGSAYAYMTFWDCPDASALFDSIADLERAGDFKFADSYHLMGTRDPNPSSPSAGAPLHPDREPQAQIGIFVQWHVGASRHAAASMPDTVLRSLADDGLNVAGGYTSRLSSGWERFAFAIAADEETAERGMGAVRRAADHGPIDLRMMAGGLEPHYRFASHLQTTFPWLNDGGPA